MLLRGVRADLLPSLTTLALAFVVSAGAVGVVGASRVGQTPGAVAAMLALYGAVALAEQSARTVVDRSHDVALGRLRGMSGARLVLFAAGPLLAVSLAGIAAGSAVGTELARRIAHGWPVSYGLGSREVVVAVGVLVGLGSPSRWSPRRSSAGRWSRRCRCIRVGTPPPWITTFLELLSSSRRVPCGLRGAPQRAELGPHHRARARRPRRGSAGDVGPRLDPAAGRRLGPSLTSRRLRRDPDPGSVVRVMVAAAVLLAVTLTGGRAAADWRDDAGRLRPGDRSSLPFDAGALRAYAAAHDADPQGKWLMAAVAIDDLDPADRRVFIDAARWDAVVGDFIGGTSVAGAGAHMTTLADQDDPIDDEGRLARGRA